MRVFNVKVRLILKEKLDREFESHYTMKLIAVDGGQSPKTGSTIVTINVIDANDNKPKFVNGSNFDVIVAENTPPGSLVCRLQAVDADEGINGMVDYSLGAQSPAGQSFAINKTTGELVVRVSD